MRLASAVSAVILCLVVSPAIGAPKADTYDTGGIVVTDHAPGRDGTPGEQGRAGGDTHRVYAYWAIVITPEGFCRERRFTTDRAEADAFDYLYDRRAAEANELADLAVCAADPAAAPRGPTPGELARDFWDVRRLPRPQPTVVPDYAVVGKRVYLQITGPPTAAFEVPNPIGPDVRIAAASRYLVDWGDGTTTTTASQGGRWPNGDVTHVYDTARPRVTIRVTQVWSATWQAGGAARGTLADLRTAGEMTIPVAQVQPVRNR